MQRLREDGDFMGVSNANARLHEAIAAHDPEGAEAAMRCHLSRVAAALRAHHDGEPPPSAPSTKKSPRRRARRAVSDR